MASVTPGGSWIVRPSGVVMVLPAAAPTAFVVSPRVAVPPSDALSRLVWADAG